MNKCFQDLNNSNILITGGLGFVGNNLARYIVNNFKCNLTIVDNCLNSNPEIISDISNKVTFKKISVLDLEFFENLGEYDYIFHLACIQIAASSLNPEEDLNINAVSTLKILEYLKTNKNKLKRFIYTSSCSVYGSSSNLPLSENGLVKPLSFYAATKFLGEQYTLICGRNYNLPVCSVRYSNVYGYGQSPLNPYCGVLGKFIHNCVTNKSLTIIGDGEQTRDYTFITDAVNATILVATHPRTIGEVYNVGTGIETSVNKLAAILSEYNEIGFIEIPERDIDNIRRRSVDIEKLHMSTGWTPEINIEKGIRLTYEWYLNNLF